MKTREIAKEDRLTHWAQIVRERSESGESIKAYCDHAGIHERSYYYWQRQLRQRACEGVMAIGDYSQPGRVVSPVFAQYKLPAQASLPSEAKIQQSQICVETAGVRVSAGSEYPIEKLAGLLRVVMQACC